MHGPMNVKLTSQVFEATPFLQISNQNSVITSLVFNECKVSHPSQTS